MKLNYISLIWLLRIISFMRCCMNVICFYLSFSSLYGLLHVLLLYYLFCNCIYKVLCCKYSFTSLHLCIKYLYLFRLSRLMFSINHMHFSFLFSSCFLFFRSCICKFKNKHMSLASDNLANSSCDLRALWVSLFCSCILTSTERFC